jgi:hypothetical protein
MLATVILQRIVKAIVDGSVVRSIGRRSQIAAAACRFCPWRAAGATSPRKRGEVWRLRPLRSRKLNTGG